MNCLQTPAAQTLSALHTLPQAPQFAGSFILSTQAVLVPTVQAVKPASQALLQAPDWHLLLASAQTPKHPPQWFGSLWKSTHPPQPLPVLSPMPHAGVAHAPAAHVFPAPQATPQALPQN